MDATSKWSPLEAKSSKVNCSLNAGGICCAGRRGEWWIRLSIDTEHMGRTEESLEVLQHCPILRSTTLAACVRAQPGLAF